MSSDFSGDSVFGGPPGPAGGAPMIDPREYLAMVLRRKWLVLAIFVLAAAGSAVYAHLSEDVYTAEAVLLIERRPHNVINVQEVMEQSPTGWDFYNTQFEILKSRSLIAKVIRRERLPFSIGYYRSALEVEPVRMSKLVRLRFTSLDPDLSARVVNAHAKAFIQRGLALRREASDGARGFLHATLVDLESRLEESESKLAQFRREHGVLALADGSSLVLGRLSALSKQLVQVESERIARGTQLALIRGGEGDSTSAFTTDPQILQLRKELRALRAQHEAGRSYLPGIAKDIEELEAELETEKQRVVKVLETEYQQVSALEKRLQSDIASQKLELLRQKDESVEYAMLQRESDSIRQIHTVVSDRQKELEMAAELRNSNVFVIDEAVPSSDPSGRSKVKMMAFGALAGLLGGLGLAFGLEFLDNNIKKPEDVETLLGIPYLGTIPEMASSPNFENSAVLAIPSASPALLPASLTAATTPKTLASIPRDVLEAREAYLSLRTNLLLSQAGAPPSPVLFTSARRGDGKTVTVMNLAVSLSQMGAPVLLIDADLRRPSCHEFLGLERDVGLTEVLAGHCEFARAVKAIKPPFFFLGSGLQPPPDPIELLASERMKAVLTEASLDYAYVLIDSPPLLPVSDSVALSPLVDGVVLVVGNKTPKPLVMKAFAKLNYARARTLGAVLNGFDLRSSGAEYVNYYEG